jgi:hypothetical protein
MSQHSPLLSHLQAPQGESCATEYSESMLDDGLILRAPLEQQKWFSDITGITEQEFRQQIEVLERNGEFFVVEFSRILFTID